MLRNKPRLTYSGLTVILSNASRFDTKQHSLLTAGGGALFSNFCLRPEFNVMQCDIRISEDKSPFLPGTKCIMLLGDRSVIDWLPECANNTLNEIRGSVYYLGGIPCIPSFYPQDADDIRSFEQQHNPLDKNYSPDENENEKEDDDQDSAKRHSRTKRSNYAFWLQADVHKAKRILTGKNPRIREQPNYKTYASADEISRTLLQHKNRNLYLDIETDYEEQNTQCFSFSFNGQTIYNVPVLTHEYKPAYSSLHFIFRALAIAIRDNTTVCHNGACFDYLVLGYKYHIPIGRVYDTMIAMHRCFPDVEKSLGHCVSYWTWEKFHKDEDSVGYMSRNQMDARLKYCGKDVYTMYLVHQAIQKYAITIPGLSHSITTAMDSIRPYLITTFLGIKYNQEKVIALQKENDRLMMQYLRIISILIGKSGMELVRRAVKGKAKAFAGSNTQCCEYFHNLLGYPVIFRSTKTGKPSLGKKVMYKLALSHPDNPVIQLVLAYRTIAKEYGTLKFIPWKDDNNKVVNPYTYDTLAASMPAGVGKSDYTNTSGIVSSLSPVA